MANIPNAKRRVQLIQAAIRVISKHGIAGSTTRKIAAEAGAPLATLHYAFETKEVLFDSVLEYCHTITADYLRKAVGESCGIETGIRQLMTAYFDQTVADPDLLAAQFNLAQYSGVSPHENPGLGYRRMDEMVVEILARSRGWDSSSIDSDYKLSRMVSMLIDGLLLRFLTEGDEDMSRDDLESAIDLAVSVAHQLASGKHRLRRSVS